MVRKITSLTALLSFIVTMITSVVLYVVPHGRVAYWADWTFLGMTKDDWGGTHTTVGTLFLLAGLVHLWLNWKPITAYMKNKARELVVMTGPMIAALAVTVFVFAGTLLGWPPMQQLLDFSAAIKDGAVATYGNPPYGHAEESPLDKFCGYLGFDPAKAVAVLEQAGYTLDKGEQTPIKDIARSRNVSPQKVFDDIRGGLGSDPFSALPPEPPQGLGKLRLVDVCKSFGLPVDEALARLRAGSFEAGPDMTLKEIAAKSGREPRDVYNALREE
jgi:hypothetical protein